jgi:tetratricopeptide (TPR) repeat protein
MIHPSAAALEAFFDDRLTPEGRRAVVAHLLHGCPRCCKTAARLAAGLLLPPLKEVVDGNWQYDYALDLAWEAFSTNFEEQLHLLEHPYLSGARTPQEAHQRLEQELQRSYQYRHSDPAKMLFHARRATWILEDLEPEDYPPGAFDDLCARVSAEVGNAYRVAGHFDNAKVCLDFALESMERRKSGNQLLLARILDLQASLFRAQRNYPRCFENLGQVYRIYHEAGDLHLAGRALIKTGIAKGAANEPEQAVALLRRGIAWIEPTRDTELLVQSFHSLVSFTVAAGRFEEGQALLDEHRAQLYGQNEPLNVLKVRWIEGRIAAGLAHVVEAETAFQDVRTGFAKHLLPDQAAVATLDLARVWVGQGRVPEIAELVAESVKIFEGLGIRREAIAALLVLQEAASKDRLTVALVERIAARLRELEQRPQPKKD